MTEQGYDANGNTLSDPSGRSFTWDFENRLTQAVVPGTNGGTITFKHDPLGRRIQKSGPLGTTNYVYDSDAVVEELDGGERPARLISFTSIHITHLSRDKCGPTSNAISLAGAESDGKGTNRALAQRV